MSKYLPSTIYHLPFTIYHLPFSRGFTLIELIVVMAIIGILATGLIVAVNPVDRINSANDASIISTIVQLGKANQTYSSARNYYVGENNDIDTAINALNSAGEIVHTSSDLPFPTGYDYGYFTNPASCTTAAGDCAGYVFWAELKSINNNPGGVQGYYIYKNGVGCKLTSASAPSSYSDLSC